MSTEEGDFLAAHVAGTGLGVTYGDIEHARSVLLVGLEPEEESPILFLRLRKAVLKAGLVVHAVAPFATRGLEKLSGRLIATSPGAEPRGASTTLPRSRSASPMPPALCTGRARSSWSGERLAEVPGALSAVAALAEASGARLAWVPRRAGERGALEAGALPGCWPVAARSPMLRPR
jgi:NADH-quinone oxidoreductase subunit G